MLRGGMKHPKKCTHCEGPHNRPTAQCGLCLAYAREYQRARRADLKRRARCQQCQAKLDREGGFCARCHSMRMAIQARRRERLRLAPLEDGR